MLVALVVLARVLFPVGGVGLAAKYVPSLVVGIKVGTGGGRS